MAGLAGLAHGLERLTKRAAVEVVRVGLGKVDRRSRQGLRLGLEVIEIRPDLRAGLAQLREAPFGKLGGKQVGMLGNPGSDLPCGIRICFFLLLSVSSIVLFIEPVISSAYRIAFPLIFLAALPIV